MATYSYNPAKITEGGKDQMRFELGDTVTDMDACASPLCDEEYEAILNKYGKNWLRAKYECVRAICMKLSFEVNTSVGGLSYSLEPRYERWKQLEAELKNELTARHSAPRAGNPASLSPHGGTPYFYNNLHTNPRKY